MSITIDSNKGEELALFLYNKFITDGINGRNNMPEDISPEGVEKGSVEHLLFITLTVAIDYQRSAENLWESSRKTFEDPATRYLFNPQQLHKTPTKKIIKDMQKYKLSKKTKKDPYIWRTVGVTFYKKWDSDPGKFIENCDWDALTILDRLKKDTHLENSRQKSDFPYLRGNKIGPLWLRMLRDNVGLELKGLENVPIPVDIHVARATLTTGVVKGSIEASLNEVYKYIRMAWFRSVENLNLEDRPMMALDVDEPLWHLSKYGCTNRNIETGECPMFNRCDVRDYCIKGKVRISKNQVELKT